MNSEDFQSFADFVSRRPSDWGENIDCSTPEELSAHLLIGLQYFFTVRRFDEAWSRSVQEGDNTFCPQTIRLIRAGYDFYAAPLEMVLSEVQKFERLSSVTYAEAFRESLRFIRAVSGILVEQLIESWRVPR